MATVAADIRGTLYDVVVNRFAASALIPSRYRWVVYRGLGRNVGKSLIYAGCHIGPGNVTIGDRVFLNHRVYIDSTDAVDIHDDAFLAMNVTVVTSTHRIGPVSRRAGTLMSAPVTIGAGSWLGAHVVVAPGVTIGRGCVIGAGSLVTRDCEPNGLYVGSPARRIRDLDVQGE